MVTRIRLGLGVLGVGGALYACKKIFIDGPMCTCKADLSGKTVIITGANTGIGLETAVDLSRRGARVILACRNEEKGQKAVETVIDRSKNKDVAFSQVDLASLKSVHAFATRMLEEEPHIDVLVNNAGVMDAPYTKTEDGFELQLAVNHLAHFLLTNLLLDRLKKAPAGRVVTVSSRAHGWGRINFDDLQSELGYKPHRAYRQSKLANVLFIQALATRLKKTNVTAYSLHPGVVQTEIARNMNTVLRSMAQGVIGSWFMRSPVRGAQTTIHCAVSKDIAQNSGQYFANCDVKKLTHPQALDNQVAEHLWHVSAELVGLENESN